MTAKAERGERLAHCAIWLAIAAIVVFLPGGFVRWFLPKELLFLVALLFSALPAVRPAGRVPRVLWGLISAAGIVLLVSALTSTQPIASLMGRWPRYEGLVAIPVYVAAVWVGARLLGPAAGFARHRQLHAAISIASIAIAVFAIFEVAGVEVIASTSERSGSLLGSASDQGIISAAFVCVLLPALLSGLAKRENWVTPAAGIIAGVLSVALSASRGALVALGAGLVVVALLWVFSKRRLGQAKAAWRGGVLVIAIGLAGAVTVLLNPLSRNRVLGATQYSSATVSDRFLIWSETADLLRSHAWLGTGPSGYVDAIAHQHGPEWFATVDPGTILDSPHNWLLQATNAGGIPLLVIALVLVTVIAVLGLRRASALSPRNMPAVSISTEIALCSVIGAGAGLVVIGVGWLTHFTAASTALLAGLFVGMCCAAERITPASGTGTVRKESPSSVGMVTARLRVALIGAWIALFAVSTAAEFPLAAAHNATSAEEANAAFEAAQSLRPWDGDIAAIAAQMFAEKASRGADGAGELGVKWAEQALNRVPKSLPVRVALGVSERATGDLSGSLQTLESAVVDQPNDPRLYAQLGVTQAMLGNRAAAERTISHAHRLAPDDPLVAGVSSWLSAMHS